MPRNTIRAATSVALVLVAATACSSTPPFCAVYPEVIEQSGSEHFKTENPDVGPLVRAYDAAIAVAPAEIVPDLALIREFHRSMWRTGKYEEVMAAHERITAVWNECP